ncbi:MULTISPECIES: YqaA family protein [Oligella]|uniref:YqaA family protein n=1 Tax=Oligella urethralis TaxID=90245 RepID=UPI0015F0C826|nr:MULTISPECIES: YqaA family protein [Oligella]
MPVLNYFIVFATGFIAATLLPAQSEAVLLGMLHLSQQSAMLLVLFATVGNVLGSVLNWWLGTQLERFKERSWFPVSEQRLVQAQDYYQRYGSWILLFSWLPIIGDPITFVAGVLRERFYRFLILVSLAKGGRYVLISLAYVYAQA